jgi:prephenate dehydrogenase
MTVQITILGLGQIGTSIGMALAAHDDIRCVGFDIDPKVARQVEKLKVFDHVDFNIPNAVKGASIVLLAIPTDQIREMIEFVGEDMQEGAVLMETCLVKQAVTQWVSELNPAGIQYVGLTPIVNSRYLETPGSGPEAAHADLFKDSVVGIVAPNTTSGQALKQAETLVYMLGAVPFFTEPVEIDGLVAATYLLPELLAAALVNVTQEQPGWYDGQKIAGSAYAATSSSLLKAGTSESMLAALMNNRENISRMLEYAAAALLAISKDIKNEDEDSLSQKLEKAYTGRERWIQQRILKKWDGDIQNTPEIPSSRESFGRLFGIRSRPTHQKKK